MQLRLLLREHHCNSILDSSLISYFSNIGFVSGFAISFLSETWKKHLIYGAFLSKNNHSVHTMTTDLLPTSTQFEAARAGEVTAL